MEAPRPAHEHERLRALAAYDVLDTPPEPAFDELVALAARLCEAPVASLNLVDESRQWAKAATAGAARELPRAESLCAHTILAGGVLEVPDTSADQRFRHAPHRFYAGAPVVTRDGHALGALSVADHVPRRLREDQRETLLTLAHQAASQLELRRHLAERQGLLADRRAHDARARALDRLAEELASTVSHELRTPITSIKGYLELVLEDADRLEAAHAGFLQIVDQNTDRLVRVVDRLVDLSSLDATRRPVDAVRVDLAELAAAAVERAAGEAQERAVALRLAAEPAAVAGEPERLGDALGHVLENALRYTPSGGTVDVLVTAAASRGVVRVADSGIGVPADELPHIFDRYYRAAAARAAGIPGAGLGLALARETVDAHAGAISARARAGGGTEVVITLPLWSAERRAA